MSQRVGCSGACKGQNGIVACQVADGARVEVQRSGCLVVEIRGVVPGNNQVGESQLVCGIVCGEVGVLIGCTGFQLDSWIACRIVHIHGFTECHCDGNVVSCLVAGS